MPTKNIDAKIEKLQADKKENDHNIYVTEKKIKSSENDLKSLVSMVKQCNRKARTHRLCNRGAMLEKYLQEPNYLTDEQVADFLKVVFHRADVQEILKKLLNETHPENPCL